MILRARIVLPVARPPIEDGAVTIAANRITAVGRWAGLSNSPHEPVIDLGDAILLPGLVNAHCHLDYTGMAGQIEPRKGFADWIKAMVALKNSWTNADFARSWREGAVMLLRTGTTTVADVEAVPDLLPDAWTATPLRVFSFRELITIKSHAQAGEIVEAAATQLAALPAAEGRVGLSPHAPYTTSPELLQLAAREARRRRWRLTTHVAESEEEFEMFLYRHGPLFDWLKAQRDSSDCGLGSPVNHLDRQGYLDENLLAVHVNYLWRDDATVLGLNKVSVAHCPRSHDYFRHLRFPRAELAAAGVNVCLGTDSLASTRKVRGEPLELNLFAEMKAFAAHSPDVPPATILQMATVNAARALGRARQIGELSPGALADLIAIPFAGPSEDALDAAIHHPGDVAASMIDGHWAIPPGGSQADEPRR